MTTAANDGAPRGKKGGRPRKVAGTTRRPAAGRGSRRARQRELDTPSRQVSAAPDAGGRAEGPESSGEVEPANSSDQDGQGQQGTWTSAGRRTPLVRVLLGVLLGVLAASLVAAGGFGIGLQELAHGPITGNAALSDRAATEQVTAEVSRAVRGSFTYDYGNPQRTEQEAAAVLTGPAIQQYRQLFGQVKQVAPQQKLVFTTTVRSAGVQEIRGDRARVLLFVDQQGVRADNDQRRSGSAQLDVTAQRAGPAWKVSEIRVL